MIPPLTLLFLLKIQHMQKVKEWRLMVAVKRTGVTMGQVSIIHSFLFISVNTSSGLNKDRPISNLFLPSVYVSFLALFSPAQIALSSLVHWSLAGWLKALYCFFWVHPPHLFHCYLLIAGSPPVSFSLQNPGATREHHKSNLMIYPNREEEVQIYLYTIT